MNLDDLQAQLGLHFRNIDVLQEALTHRSYINDQPDTSVRNNERLEFLGDTVLDFVVTDVLFRRYPDMPEGELTQLRQSLVRTEALAELAQVCNLGEFLRMSRGEEKSGGRQRKNMLADTFEALAGALYLDQGTQAVEDFVMPFFLPRLERILSENLHKNARSMLQEWSQAEYGIAPTYRVIEATGPDHEKLFTVEVVLGEQVIGMGSGSSKHAAIQAAARTAFDDVNQHKIQILAPPVVRHPSDVSS